MNELKQETPTIMPTGQPTLDNSHRNLRPGAALGQVYNKVKLLLNPHLPCYDKKNRQKSNNCSFT